MTTTTKKLRTNSKEVKERVRKYILETVHDDKEQEYKTFEEAAKKLKKEFNRVANFPNNIKRIPNNVDRFKDYLQGVPFWFPVYNSDVEDILNGFGINPEGKEYPSDKMWNLFALLIYREIEKQ